MNKNNVSKHVVHAVFGGQAMPEYVNVTLI